MTTKPRRQCLHCPWKVSTDPHQIPNGYCPTKHANLKDTIAKPSDPSSVRNLELRVMACHETHRLPCVGWLENQLGEGNNLQLRLAVIQGRIDANVRIVGKQHPNFEATLP